MTNGYQQFFKKAKQVAESGPTQFRPRMKIKSETAKPRMKPKETQDRRGPRPEMVEELRSRMKQKGRRPKKKMPIQVILSSSLGVLVCILGFWKMDVIEKYSKTVEFSLMGYAGAQEKDAGKETKKDGGTGASTAKTDGKTNDKIDGKTKDKQDPKAEMGKHEYSDEEINHFAKLNERKRELDAREEELNRLDQEIVKKKDDLEKRLKELENTRREISSVLQEKVQADDKKIDSLVQMYSNMKAQQAAKVFESMDEDLAIEILGRMKKKPAAEILNLVKPEKAQVLSEKFAGFKRQ